MFVIENFDKTTKTKIIVPPFLCCRHTIYLNFRFIVQ